GEDEDKGETSLDPAHAKTLLPGMGPAFVGTYGSVTNPPRLQPGEERGKVTFDLLVWRHRQRDSLTRIAKRGNINMPLCLDLSPLMCVGQNVPPSRVQICPRPGIFANRLWFPLQERAKGILLK